MKHENFIWICIDIYYVSPFNDNLSPIADIQEAWQLLNHSINLSSNRNIPLCNDRSGKVKKRTALCVTLQSRLFSIQLLFCTEPIQCEICYHLRVMTSWNGFICKLWMPIKIQMTWSWNTGTNVKCVCVCDFLCLLHDINGTKIVFFPLL